MKPLKVLFTEALLAELDKDEEVRRNGRSAVLRRLVAEHLQRRREAELDARYREGYAGGIGLGPEFEGWEEEGAWPNE